MWYYYNMIFIICKEFFEFFFKFSSFKAKFGEENESRRKKEKGIWRKNREKKGGFGVVPVKSGRLIDSPTVIWDFLP
jgi:hypothetical protein